MITKARDKASRGGSGTRPGDVVASVLRNDLPASLVVFLVAMPLSLGIAVASGAPVIAGLIAAIVGGIVAGAVGGSPLQVSGPAAGLTVIVASLVQTYGWRATCAITLCAGLLQLVLGACKVARAALAVSPAVVHGMLAGVGVVIALAQLHVVLGGRPQQSALANLQELPGQIINNHSHAVVVGVLTIVVLLAWSRLPARARVIPAPLSAIGLATAVAWILNWDVPRVDLPSSLLGSWSPPELPVGGVPHLIGAVVSVALVASVESLLCSVAVDRMRTDGAAPSDLDRELVGQGAANVVSGALGGLPVAGVIVRSSANVQAGARTRASTIMHGVWILVLTLALGPAVKHIPLSALAALLVAIGLRMLDLAHLRDLRHHREVPIYLATLGSVVFLGLAEGVLVGMVLAAFLALRRLTHLTLTTEQEGTRWHVVVGGSLTFLGVPKLLRALQAVPPRTSVDLDLCVDFMDNAAFDAIHNWRVSHERLGGRVDIDEVHEAWYGDAVSGAPRTLNKASSPAIRWWAPWSSRRRLTGDARPTAPTARALLLEGAQEFHNHTAPLLRPIMAELVDRQTPSHMFITCADSRLVPNLITASGPGDLFTVRNIGNLVPAYRTGRADDSVDAAVEYAIEVLQVRTIIVCGHSRCGAMAALLSGGEAITELPGLNRWLEHGNHSLARFLTDDQNGESDPLTRLCQLNVIQQLDNLRTYPKIAARVETGEIELVGMYFDLETADVHVLNQQDGTFSPATTTPDSVEPQGSESVAANPG